MYETYHDTIKKPMKCKPPFSKISLTPFHGHGVQN